MRRVAGLDRLAELVLIREKLRREDPEPDPQQVGVLIGMLVSEVEQVVEDVAEPEVASMFMRRLREKMRAADFPASTSTTPGTTP